MGLHFEPVASFLQSAVIKTPFQSSLVTPKELHCPLGSMPMETYCHRLTARSSICVDKLRNQLSLIVHKQILPLDEEFFKL